MVVKERPKSPLFIILCILLVHAARHEIIHQIHVKNDFSFPLWKLLNSPLPTCTHCIRFVMDFTCRLSFLWLYSLKRKRQRGTSLDLIFLWKKQLQRNIKLIGRSFISGDLSNNCEQVFSKKGREIYANPTHNSEKLWQSIVLEYIL